MNGLTAAEFQGLITAADGTPRGVPAVARMSTYVCLTGGTAEEARTELSAQIYGGLYAELEAALAEVTLNRAQRRAVDNAVGRVLAPYLHLEYEEEE